MDDQTNDQTVTMHIPEDQVEAVQEGEVVQEESAKTETIPVTASDAVIKQVVSDNLQEVGAGLKDGESITIQSSGKTVQRDTKGHFLPGNQESKGLTNSGRPCSFCEKPFEIMQKIKLYSEWTKGNVDGHLHIPYLEELCDDDYLDIHTDTLADWIKQPHDSALHSELIQTIKKLLMRQKRLLLKKSLGTTPAGSIFQLKANHGMIETEKQILAGAAGEPVRYDIQIIPKISRQNDGE